MTIQIFAAHSDDAPYSTSLYLDQKSKDTKILLVYVFNLTNYAPNLQQLHRNDTEKVTDIRYSELKKFCDVLKVDLQALNFLDACLRPDYVGKEVCHSRPMTRTDEGLVNATLEHTIASDLTLFPLAIGDHIDHRILLNAGILCGKKGKNVGFYEDLPYSYEFDEKNIDSYIKEIEQKNGFNLQKVIIKDSDFVKKKTLNSKINASQVSDRYIDEIIAYSKRRLSIDGGQERLWLLKN